MPTNDARRDEIRKILLSLLLARPGTTSVTVLDRDYFEVENERIPWRKFGYANIVEFLKSMPEYFELEWCNGMHYVRGIASEKTKHVSSLVSRQKFTPKSKYIPPQFRYNFRSYVNRHLPQMQRQRIRIPAEQLSSLVKYIKNNPNGVSMRNVMQMLQKQLPHVVLSMCDIREQLRELSHSLYLDCDMIYPKPVNDISQETENCPQPPTLESQNVPRSPAMCVGGDEGSDILEDNFSDEDIFDNYLSTPKQPKTSERLTASFGRNANNEENAMFNHNDDVDVDEYFAATNNNADNLNTMITDYVDSSLISDRIKSRLDQLVRKHPEGIWCADLPEKYFKEYNIQLNYSDLGFISVRQYVSYLPDIFYMTRVNSTDDFLLYSADKRPTVPDQELTRTEPIEIRPSSRKQHDEHDAVRIQCNGDDNAPIPADVSPTITKTFAPDDVMNYDDSVDQILVTDLQRIYDKRHLEVYIVEIFNPSFFWVHLRENKRRFDVFMDDLHTFYEYNKDKYTIPKIALKKGLNCACIYANRWHRGIIKSVKPDFKVTVMFYDYGTLKMYAPEDVYYLHKQFSFLFAQAIPCGLFNVRPCVGDRWKKSVTDQLIDKINETLLALTIVTVDSLNNSMMVILSDTSEEEDVHINDWLIDEKLAQRGKMGDAVDMASIMKYVVTNLNQLPTYCFAEESLMSDSRCKATSTEEMHEKVPLVSSKQTHLCHDDLEHSVRPPPGFAPLGEKSSLSNISTKSSDMYSFGNASNAKTSSYDNAEASTNPFLSDQQFVNDNVMPNDIAKQIFTPIWNENVQLFIKLTKFLYDMLEHSPLNRNIFKNHMIIQYHLNKFLKSFEKTLMPDSDQSVGTSSASLNLARETTPDKIGLAEKTAINSNAESFVNQNLAGMINNVSLSNPFDRSSQTHNMFSAYDSNGYTSMTNWHQSDGFNPHVQLSSPVTPMTPVTPVTPTSARSIFTNYGSSATANVFFPNADQGSENAPSATKPLSPVIPNVGVSDNNRNSSNFFNTVNNEFANVFKETNPFKFSIINEMQKPEKQSERMVNNYDTESYLSVKNLHDHSSKMEAANIYAGNNGFMTAVNGVENYTPRIVYEAGPVMYNTQKKQTDANMKHSACNNDLKNNHDISMKGHCDNKELSSQSANDTLYSKYSSQIDEGYFTRPPTNYTLQNSSSIINSEPNYHQQNGNAEQIISPQTWKQVEISERWINPQFQNGIPLQNHNEKSTSTSTNFSAHKDRNCDNNRESVTRGITDLSYIFNWCDKERPIDMYKNFWNNPSYIENQKSTDYRNVNNDFLFDTSFVFQKIDSVKNTTFVFHTEGEGWMLTHEFVITFTNLKLCSRLIDMLEKMNVKVAFKEIQRSDYPAQFLQLDRYPINVPRDSDKRIDSIHLISLQSALSLLHKLKIVTREEIDNAFKKKEFLNSSVLPDMWMLIVVYRDLKRRIEQCNMFWNMSA